MDKYMEILKRSQLFSGLDEKEILSILKCLFAHEVSYDKDEFVMRYGDSVSSIGLVLSGCVHVVKEDYWGKRNIIAEVTASQMFAESYACAFSKLLEVSITAAVPSRILFLDTKKILTSCASSCAFHTKIIRNLLSSVAAKNLQLNEKLTHITQRNTREKLLSYLHTKWAQCGKSEFEIPFNREQLASYLSVDRSAMSNELSKMRDEGLIKFHKNHFEMQKLSLNKS